MMDTDETPPSSLQRALSARTADLELRSGTRFVADAPRPVVVVLGMHRSGTSLLSNVLHVLGVDMADTTDRVNEKNAGGYWERPDMFRLQDEVLAAIGRPIATPSHVLPFPAAWWRRKEVQALKPKLVAYLREELSRSANPWGFKDPRTCRLLPLWWEVFREVNVEPIYIHAIRSPAEAAVSMSQQSSARRITPATGELMWLSYNYDIARYVTLKAPALVVEYAEWFADPLAVARRLCEQLGIGGDLSSEDLAECMSSIVQAEYRHQFEDSATDGSIAGMLYKSLTQSNPLDQNGLRTLRGHVRLVDMFFKSAAPVVRDLDMAASTQLSLENERQELVEKQNDLVEKQNDLVEKQHDLVEKEGVTEQLLMEKTAAAAALEKSIAELEARVSKSEAEVVELREALATSRQSLDSEASTGAVQRRRLDREQKRSRALLHKAREWRDVADALKNAIAELEARVSKSEAEVEELREDLATSRHSLDSEASRVAVLERRLDREQKRTRALLEKAREWRDTYVAEHGEPDTRLDEVARAAELQRSLDLAERRLASAEETRARFVTELELRDRALATVRREQAAHPPAASAESERVFTWPGDGDPIKVAGRIDRVDAAGIAGHVTVKDRPDVVPIVEVRVDQMLVAAQTCLAVERPERTLEGNWRFAFRWDRFGPEHAGKEAVLVVAGLDHELGKAAMPEDLPAYQRSPAARAASELGGTIAEAAEYQRWLLEVEDPQEAELAREFRSDSRTAWPPITIIVYGRNEAQLPLTLQSLQSQVYPNWEALCLDAPAEAAEMDPRVRAVSSEVLGSVMAEYPEKALVSFVEAGDLLGPTALLHLADAARTSSDFALIYSDEDLTDPNSGLRAVPYMKGAWSPDLALSQDYICRLGMVRRSTFDAARPIDRANVYEIMLRAAFSGSGPVVHVPFVLYHRSAGNAAKALQPSSVVQSVIDSTPALNGGKVVTDERGQTKVRWPLPDPEPRVSLIVPTRDRPDLLRECVRGFLHDTRYSNLEILIADNESQEEETKVYLAKVSTHPRVRVIPCPGSFNFSKINNLAAEHATGEIIGLMNNDLEVFEPDWLREMVSHAVRPDVGIVGAKLLFADGTIQHAGVTLGISLASHLYKFTRREAEGHQGRLSHVQDVSAVTAACLLIRRDVWNEVGGLDEQFPVAYNDVDLCLKVRAAGYRILWTPDAQLYHLESKSRGKDATPEKRERLNQDKARLIERWGDALSFDPFHSPNFSATSTDPELSFPPRVAAPWQPAIAAQ